MQGDAHSQEGLKVQAQLLLAEVLSLALRAFVLKAGSPMRGRSMHTRHCRARFVLKAWCTLDQLLHTHTQPPLCLYSSHPPWDWPTQVGPVVLLCGTLPPTAPRPPKQVGVVN